MGTTRGSVWLCADAWYEAGPWLFSISTTFLSILPGILNLILLIYTFSQLYVPTCARRYTVLLATMTPGLPRWPSHKSTLVATLVETAAREVRPAPIVAMNTHLQQPRKKTKCSRLTDAFHRPRIALKEQQSFPNQENSQHYVHCHHHTVMLTIWRFFYRTRKQTLPSLWFS